jgi:hypothetical protein
MLSTVDENCLCANPSHPHPSTSYSSHLRLSLSKPVVGHAEIETLFDIILTGQMKMADADEDAMPRGDRGSEESDLTEETQDFRFLASVPYVSPKFTSKTQN